VGAVLNELGDVLSDSALYLPFALAFPSAAAAVVAFAIGASVTEFCGVLGKALGATRHYEGPMGKSDRALVVGVMAVGLAFFGRTADFLPWVLWIATAFEAVTCLNRTRGALRDLRPATGSAG
jgi:CDP-diacylglycerol--glycerol-3-phosphate 3-phosphatidyltransferase